MRSVPRAHERHGDDPPPRRLRRVGTTLLLAVVLTGGLLVPAPSGHAARRWHAVRRGDTLSTLARSHHVRGGWRAMYRANRSRLRRPGLVRVGQRLRIPGARGGARRAHRTHGRRGVHRRRQRRGRAAQARRVRRRRAERRAAADRIQSRRARRRSSRRSVSRASRSARSGRVAVWNRLARCESSGNWHINTGNGYYGGLQFSLSSWRGVGGHGYPHRASKATQIRMAERLLASQGWGAWPACSRMLGLR